MRIPLRFQIVIPLALVIFLTMLALTVIQANLASRRTQSQIETQLQGVTRTLESSSFPLTASVLQQMKGLTGAEFILESPSGSTVSTLQMPEELLNETLHQSYIEPTSDWRSIRLQTTSRIGGKSYFHVCHELQQRGASREVRRVHILYPEDQYRSARWDAVFPSVVLGSVAVLTTILCGLWIAKSLCRTVSTIGSHVDRVAQGHFEALPAPGRNDELRDLVVNVNLMSEQLSDYETHIRHTEQLRTLSQLGAGLAHEMRNATTGARLALQIHAEVCPLGSDCESLEVAQRQTRLVETHVQRLLSLGTPVEGKSFHSVDLVSLVQELLPLAEPQARHLGVLLEWKSQETPLCVLGDKEALGQVFLNLVFNAIESFSQANGPFIPADKQHPKEVTISLETSDTHAMLEIRDTGSGPSSAIGEKLFDPFISDKKDGIGLGLSVAKQVVTHHGGEIKWDRIGKITRFVVTLPLNQREGSDRCRNC